MERLIIQVTLKIWTSAGQCKKALEGFNVSKILICGRNDFTSTSTLDSSFYVFEQQNKASLLDEADRKAEGGTLPQVISDLF